LIDIEDGRTLEAQRCAKQRRNIMAEASGPAVTLAASLGMQRPIVMRALLLGERLATHRFERQEALARTPLTIGVREGGLAILFRYGVIVLMNVRQEAEAALLGRLASVVSDPFEPRESDEARIDVRADADDQIDVNGMIVLKELTLERLQLVADVLAKGLMLSHYESRIATGFDRIEPMAESLRRRGRIGIAVTPLLRQIGNALLVQHKMVGRVETGEKPDLLWDHAELERFYARLAEEYELRERSRALDHKQDIILRTSEILLGLVQERGNTRLEWYVLILILAELAVAIYSIGR
jgi:required for meiotic nuclear division protein 1